MWKKINPCVTTFCNAICTRSCSFLASLARPDCHNLWTLRSSAVIFPFVLFEDQDCDKPVLNDGGRWGHCTAVMEAWKSSVVVNSQHPGLCILSLCMRSYFVPTGFEYFVPPGFCVLDLGNGLDMCFAWSKLRYFGVLTPFKLPNEMHSYPFDTCGEWLRISRNNSQKHQNTLRNNTLFPESDGLKGTLGCAHVLREATPLFWG